MRKQAMVIESEVIHKSDVFSLGMTLLEAASLKSSWECYDN
jgi:hypothetical protein